MTYFESLLTLLLVAVLLLQFARRMALPYPAMLAASGVALAFIPGTPAIVLAPGTALALFIAPAIVDAAFDFPPGAARRFWGPLVTFVIFAVLITAAVVALLATHLLHVPWAVGLILGAIVAPPDAAAATAVLGSVSIPRSTESVLKGESLFNDASALLLYTGALAVFAEGHLSGLGALRLSLAVPGGLALGIVFGLLARYTSRFVQDTLGGNLLQFLYSFAVWLVAERLGLSAVLCTIAFAMTLAGSEEITSHTRMRVQSFAVWGAVVFTLNVLAFLLMGMQARQIISRMPAATLRSAFLFAGQIVLSVIVVRFVVVVGVNRLNAWRHRRRGEPEAASWRQGVLVGWCGMRGFVTLATAFALPPSLPRRDLLVLTAFSVVLATLVLQGFTLAPLIRLLRLDRSAENLRELAEARATLAQAALDAFPNLYADQLLPPHPGPHPGLHPDPQPDPETQAAAEHLRVAYTLERDQGTSQSAAHRRAAHQRLALGLVQQERLQLELLRAEDRISSDTYLRLQEEIDWRELTQLPDEERRLIED